MSKEHHLKSPLEGEFDYSRVQLTKWDFSSLLCIPLYTYEQKKIMDP